MLRVSVNAGIWNSVFWVGVGPGAPWSGTGCAEAGRTALSCGGLLATALSCLPSLGRDAQGLYVSALPNGEYV